MHAHALWSSDQVNRMFILFLANGVTTIRDMGSPLPVDETLSWRKKVANGTVLGPRIFAAGKLVDGPKETQETQGQTERSLSRFGKEWRGRRDSNSRPLQ